MTADDHQLDHLPVRVHDDLGFLDQLERSGVDYHMVEQLARQDADTDIDIVYPDLDIDIVNQDADIDIVYPDMDQFATVDQAAQGLIDTIPDRGRGSRRPAPTTSTPNRRPGQPAGVPNTTYSPRGVGRARVDPATSMRQANIMDIFPVEIHGCHCDALDRNHGEWLNPAQNTHGQSVKVTARVMPEIERFFQYIAGRGDFPYKTMEDVIRHAINRHCEWLNRQESMPDHFLVVLRQINTIMRDEMAKKEIEENLPGLITLATSMVKKGFVEQASKILHQIRSSIAVVVDEEHKHQLQTMYQKYVAMLVEEVKLRFPQGLKRELLTSGNNEEKAS